MTENEAPAATSPAEPGCPGCGAGRLRPSTVSSVFWRGEQALMVRDNPAIVCSACGEDFISDETVIELDRIKDQGFDGVWTDTFVKIPVFSLARARPGGDG